MFIIKCDKCKKIMEFLDIDKDTSYDFIDYWRKKDNHLCNPCWMSIRKKNAPKELEYNKDKDTGSISIVGTWPDDMEEHGDLGWRP